MKLSLVLLVTLLCVLSVSLALGASPAVQRLQQRQTQTPRPAAAASAARPATAATTQTTSAAAGSTAPGFGTCWIGKINDCTGESMAWTDTTHTAQSNIRVQMASLGVPIMAGESTASVVGFALAEVDAESESEVEAETEADAETEVDSETEAEAEAESESTQAKCAGTCMTAGSSACKSKNWFRGVCPGASVCCLTAAARPATPAPAAPAAPAAATNPKCAGSCMTSGSSSCVSKNWLRGVCPGASVCCLTAAAPAPAPAPAAATGLVGVATRVKDPTVLVAGGRSIVWADLTAEQQNNARLLVRYAKQQSITSINQVAYILATAAWECHLKPIKEYGGAKTRYAPYFGRGFVQLTWRENYRTMTNLLKSQAGITADLVKTPDLALNPTNAAFIAAYGMKHGSFTSKKLSDYFSGTTANWVAARAIINGKDKADIIAQLGRSFVRLTTLLMA